MYKNKLLENVSPRCLCVFTSVMIIHNNRRMVWFVDFPREKKKFRFGWIEAD